MEKFLTRSGGKDERSTSLIVVTWSLNVRWGARKHNSLQGHLKLFNSFSNIILKRGFTEVNALVTIL